MAGWSSEDTQVLAKVDGVKILEKKGLCGGAWRKKTWTILKHTPFE